MPKLVLGASVGILFGFGLSLSQMIDPQRILGFLTISRDWDPTLAFVMAGALLITIPGFALLRARGQPLFAADFARPPRGPIDRGLLFGAALFGLGWGLSGYCPGPAVVASGLGYLNVLLVFLPAMIFGAWLAKVIGQEN